MNCSGYSESPGGSSQDEIPSCVGLWDSIKNLKDVLEVKDPTERLPAILLSTIKQFSETDVTTRRDVVERFIKDDAVCLHRLFVILGGSNCLGVNVSICRFLEILLGPSYKAMRPILIKEMISMNATEFLMKALITSSSETNVRMDLPIISILNVLAKVAAKDSKASIKMRLRGGLKVCNQLLQNSSKLTSSMLPLLHIMKLHSKCSSNQLALGKMNIMATMVNLQISTSKGHWLKQQLIMEIFANLTKIKTNCDRFITENCLPRLLLILENWERIDKRHQYKLLRALLSTISHLCDSKHNKTAVINQRSLEYIHRFASSCPNHGKMDSLFSISLNILFKCASRTELPIGSLKRNAHFKTPIVDSPVSRDCFRELTPDSDSEQDDSMRTEPESSFDLIVEHKPASIYMEDLHQMAPFFCEYNGFKVCNTSQYSIIDSPLWRDAYSQISCSTRSVSRFVKLAYPDMIGATSIHTPEPFTHKDIHILRERLLSVSKRALNPELYQEKIVFDLDFLLESGYSKDCESSHDVKTLTNWDEKLIGRKDIIASHLNFESRFESGNLRRAIQVSELEYDLLLSPDINSTHHHQWFYFEVSNMISGLPYTFNIINNEKSNSEFNYGMQPLLFSVTEAMDGSPYWVRSGFNVCYYKNHYLKAMQRKRHCVKSYYTASFTIVFQHSHDICYMAYHFPYTYTKLQTFLGTLGQSIDPTSNLFYSNQVLCFTLNGNRMPVLTITNKGENTKKKPVIFLTARVHPGETNSSYLIQGVIEVLLSNTSTAQNLRDQYVFKILPMLNPEGVINGNQRCGLTDEDLNRRWISPNPTQHPTIYSSKALLEFMDKVLGRKPLVFCDFHGHSRQKNIFMYGCSKEKSWWIGDKKSSVDDTSVLILPQLTQYHMPTFSYNDCSFNVERGRESTARVTVWRQFNIPFSYTMEVSTSGNDRGPYANLQLNTHRILQSGEGFCEALLRLPAAISTGSIKPSFPDRKQLKCTAKDDFNNESDSEMDFDAYN